MTSTSGIGTSMTDTATTNTATTSIATIRIATRKSALALWQANWVKDQLASLGHASELVLVDSQGDKDKTSAFAAMQGQGFFTKSVQDAITEGHADMAVHSFKDLPSAPHPQLEIAAMTERADPRDVLVIRNSELLGQSKQGQRNIATLEALSLVLQDGAKVGTSAVRRQKQLVSFRPDLEVAELRGNVPTRIQKLRDGDYDAIVLAAAGIERLALELDDLYLAYLQPEFFVPAPAQGVLALECNRDNYQLAQILNDLNHMETYRCVAAERGLMAMLQGGCQLALGAYAQRIDHVIHLRTWYEGQLVAVEQASPEGAAMLAYDALGWPAHNNS